MGRVKSMAPTVPKAISVQRLVPRVGSYGGCHDYGEREGKARYKCLYFGGELLDKKFNREMAVALLDCGKREGGDIDHQTVPVFKDRRRLGGDLIGPLDAVCVFEQGCYGFMIRGGEFLYGSKQRGICVVEFDAFLTCILKRGCVMGEEVSDDVSRHVATAPQKRFAARVIHSLTAIRVYVG